jgi:hypothetical protein
MAEESIGRARHRLRLARLEVARSRTNLREDKLEVTRAKLALKEAKVVVRESKRARRYTRSRPRRRGSRGTTDLRSADDYERTWTRAGVRG